MGFLFKKKEMIHLAYENLDYTPLGSINYDRSKVPAEIKKHADYVRTKAYGIDVREAQARADEITGIIASEAVGISNTTKGRQNDLEKTFDSLKADLLDIRGDNGRVLVISSKQTKPAISEMGKVLLEHDTGKVFYFDGAEWRESI